MSAIKYPADYGLGLTAIALLVCCKMPSWRVVLPSAVGGSALALLASPAAA